MRAVLQSKFFFELNLLPLVRVVRCLVFWVPHEVEVVATCWLCCFLGHWLAEVEEVDVCSQPMILSMFAFACRLLPFCCAVGSISSRSISFMYRPKFLNCSPPSDMMFFTSSIAF